MNIFACLVHEAADCVADLLANLRYLDPASGVLLYDGSGGTMKGDLEALAAAWRLQQGPSVALHPNPQAMEWGFLHGFAVDCMRTVIDIRECTSVTFVDSDQLLLRPGYSDFLRRILARHPEAGCLATTDEAVGPDVDSGPCVWAWKEVEMWRPFLRRFPDGERLFPLWSFWPSTVFSRSGMSGVLRLWQDSEFQEIVRSSQIWATEEILLPTLVALAGRRVLRNPCDPRVVQYQADYTLDEMKAAADCPEAFWVHPVPRVFDDPRRRWVRDLHSGYGTSGRTAQN